MDTPDPMVIYSRVLDEIVKGQHESALDGLSWIFHHGADVNPMFNVLRRTYGLGTWQQLAKIYPPAKIALQRLYAEKKSQLLDDASNAGLIADIAALDEYSR